MFCDDISNVTLSVPGESLEDNNQALQHHLIKTNLDIKPSHSDSKITFVCSVVSCLVPL